jgi:hypothetical protein
MEEIRSCPAGLLRLIRARLDRLQLVKVEGDGGSER